MLSLLAQAQEPSDGSLAMFVEKLARLPLAAIVIACVLCTLLRAVYSRYLSEDDHRDFQPISLGAAVAAVLGIGIWWGISGSWFVLPAIGILVALAILFVGAVRGSQGGYNTVSFWIPAALVFAMSIWWGITEHPLCFLLGVAPVVFAAQTYFGRPDRAARLMHDLFDAVIYAGIVVFMILRPYGIQTFRIPSPSMIPGLQVGDIVIVDKFTYRFRGEPQFQDRVVFRPPERALKLAGHTDPNTDYVKRCIGLPGDKIELKDGVLYRNDKMVDEPYLRKEPGINSGDFKLVMYKGKLIPIRRRIAEGTNQGSADEYAIDPADEESVWSLPAEKVPPGFYLMLGDNRSGSADSRLWGLVPRDQIVGKVWFVLFSPRRIGLSDAPEG